MSDVGGDNTARIAVLVKQIPDPGQIAIDAESRAPQYGGSLVVNTFDTYAVAEAIDFKERYRADVTVVSVGPAPARDAILRGLATGADRGLHLVVDDLDRRDSLAVATLIADALRDRGFDLILAGQISEDVETGQVGPQVAELLGIPHVSLVTGIEVDGAEFRIRRDSEGRKQLVGVAMPCMALVLSGRDGEQRHPTLRGMMQAKRKPIEEIVVPSFDETPRMTWSDPVAPVRVRTAVIAQDVAPADAAKRLVGWLHEKKIVV
ncbi:MAG TPA: electron transfer flavoprotein subunit beta/FixA family protein [Thermomicrobiales bacterium]|nr:electron transfer flavoprotein subunit beta/FixA family protein [Thermomicrobiales bacterium]